VLHFVERKYLETKELYEKQQKQIEGLKQELLERGEYYIAVLMFKHRVRKSFTA
jgi:hypothetical protein